MEKISLTLAQKRVLANEISREKAEHRFLSQNLLDSNYSDEDLKEIGLERKGQQYINDSALGFIQTALQAQDTVIHRPLNQFLSYRDVPMKVFGGVFDEAAYFKASYSTTVDNAASGSMDVRTTVQSTFVQIKTSIKTFSYTLKMSDVDQMRFEAMNIPMAQENLRGIQLSSGANMDNIAFFGFKNDATSKGLINYDEKEIEGESVIAADQVTKLTKDYSALTVNEWIEAITSQISRIFREANEDTTFLPNRILMPTSVFSYLTKVLVVAGELAGQTYSTVITNAVNKLLADYTGDDSAKARLVPNRYLEGKGANNNGRIVIYKYDEQLLRVPMSMPLTQGMTVYNSEGILTKFYEMAGELQVLYPSQIAYIDNKATS